MVERVRDRPVALEHLPRSPSISLLRIDETREAHPGTGEAQAAKALVVGTAGGRDAGHELGRVECREVPDEESRFLEPERVGWERTGSSGQWRAGRRGVSEGRTSDEARRVCDSLHRQQVSGEAGSRRG